MIAKDVRTTGKSTPADRFSNILLKHSYPCVKGVNRISIICFASVGNFSCIEILLPEIGGPVKMIIDTLIAMTLVAVFLLIFLIFTIVSQIRSWRRKKRRRLAREADSV